MIIFLPILELLVSFLATLVTILLRKYVVIYVKLVAYVSGMIEKLAGYPIVHMISFCFANFSFRALALLSIIKYKIDKAIDVLCEATIFMIS